MVTFEYRKFDLVSNYREYNLLWSELEVLFDNMPDKNQISADLMYIERNTNITIFQIS